MTARRMHACTGITTVVYTAHAAVAIGVSDKITSARHTVIIIVIRLA